MNLNLNINGQPELQIWNVYSNKFGKQNCEDIFKSFIIYTLLVQSCDFEHTRDEKEYEKLSNIIKICDVDSDHEMTDFSFKSLKFYFKECCNIIRENIIYLYCPSDIKKWVKMIDITSLMEVLFELSI
jgi:hypothetical protein